MPALMAGKFDLQGEVKRLRQKGKTEEDIKVRQTAWVRGWEEGRWPHPVQAPIQAPI